MPHLFKFFCFGCIVTILSRVSNGHDGDDTFLEIPYFLLPRLRVFSSQVAAQQRNALADQGT